MHGLMNIKDNSPVAIGKQDVSTHIYLPTKMKQIECSESSTYKLQTPGNYPKKHTTYRTRRKLEIKKMLENDLSPFE